MVKTMQIIIDMTLVVVYSNRSRIGGYLGGLNVLCPQGIKVHQLFH